jgi:hypothetical protein
MRNQNFARRLEAPGTSPMAPPRRPTLRPKGEELEQLLIAIIRRIAGSLKGGVPSPSQLFYDLAREDARACSIASCGQAIVALAMDPRVGEAQLIELELAFSGWLDSLRATSVTSLRTQWERETTAQAEADIAQCRAVVAIELRDPCAIAAAIDETREHLAHERCVLSQLYVAQRELVAA